ncbi:hypothetical protein BBL79_07825 [Vibrio parahaemolyticus]|nr:hypothetical protein BBM87_13465 [Vibrio parahaemolyticus]ODW18138.1 hypothetical protein BBL79_07825 [Vibrio parahaemolyticus]
MRVLYINTFSLLYSERYINNNESVRNAYRSGHYKTTLDVMESIPHDTLSAKLLERGARDLLINMQIFNKASIAPDIDWTGVLRMGSNNHIARIRKHVEIARVSEWRSCGDLFYWELNHLRNLHLKSPSNKGVTPQLLRQIRAIEQVKL